MKLFIPNLPKVNLIYLVLGLMLTACNSGTSTSNTPADYGQLGSYNLAASYTLDQITTSAYANICQGMTTDSANCQSNLTNIESNFGFQIESIENNSLSITGVSAYNITYNSPGLTTDGQLNYRDRTVSGTIYVPQGISADKIKGIILYYHPTAYNFNDYGPAMDAANGVQFQSLYAVNGYIVVMPDMLGFGVDNTEMHPYIYPKIDVQAGINMLKAANQMFHAVGINFSSTVPLILNGFSEGGMLTQWASYMIQNKQVSLSGTNTNLALTVPMSGGFQLESIQSPMEYANLTAPTNNVFHIESQLSAAIAKPALNAYAVVSYNYYNPSTQCSDILLPAFCNFSLNGTSFTSIDQLFEAPNQPSTNETQTILWEVARSMSAYSVNNNSIDSFTQQVPLASFVSTYYAVGLTSWQTTSPIAYLHLARDSLLSPYNTINTFAAVSIQSMPGLVTMTEINNDLYVEGNPAQPIDHNNPIQYLAALAAFESYVK